MRPAARLKKLEAIEAQRPVEPDWPDEDEWLELYEAWGAAGEFAREPDFPAALAALRTSVEQARLSADPPWVPPEHYDASPVASKVREAVRRQDWRARHFPHVASALEWLREMRHRLVEGIPPVSEAEFAELAAWLEANAERLNRLADRNSPELLDVGRIGTSLHPVRVRSWMVKFGLKDGPRAEDSGRCAETVRRLRALFPA